MLTDSVLATDDDGRHVDRSLPTGVAHVRTLGPAVRAHRLGLLALVAEMRRRRLLGRGDRLLLLQAVRHPDGRRVVHSGRLFLGHGGRPRRLDDDDAAAGAAQAVGHAARRGAVAVRPVRPVRRHRLRAQLLLHGRLSGRRAAVQRRHGRGDLQQQLRGPERLRGRGRGLSRGRRRAAAAVGARAARHREPRGRRRRVPRLRLPPRRRRPGPARGRRRAQAVRAAAVRRGAPAPPVAGAQLRVLAAAGRQVLAARRGVAARAGRGQAASSTRGAHTTRARRASRGRGPRGTRRARNPIIALQKRGYRR